MILGLGVKGTWGNQNFRREMENFRLNLIVGRKKIGWKKEGRDKLEFAAKIIL